MASIVFAERSGAVVEKKIFRSICKYFDVGERDVTYYLKNEIVVNGTLYQTRHESISDLFYKFIFNNDEGKNYISEDEKVDAIEAVMNYYFDELSNYSKCANYGDRKVNQIGELFKNAFTIIEEQDNIEYLIQRLFESCKQIATGAIYSVYTSCNNTYFKNFIGEKCYKEKMSVFSLYEKWIKEAIIEENSDHQLARQFLMNISEFPGVPYNIFSF